MDLCFSFDTTNHVFSIISPHNEYVALFKKTHFSCIDPWGISIDSKIRKLLEENDSSNPNGLVFFGS